MPEGIGYSDAAARGAASQPTQRPSSAERGDARPREEQEVRRPSQAQSELSAIFEAQARLEDLIDLQ